MSEKERVTVDLDAECYYLDGEFWTSWEHYGEDMADEINKLLNEQEEELMMQREKALYWRNKAENIWGDMKTNIELQDENKKLKKRIKSKERVIKAYEDYIKTLKEDGVLDD